MKPCDNLNTACPEYPNCVCGHAWRDKDNATVPAEKLQAPGAVAPKKPPFVRELTALINRHSIENDSNTPDFALADFMLSALTAAEQMVLCRDGWYGISPKPSTPQPASRESAHHGSSERDEALEDAARVCDGRVAGWGNVDHQGMETAKGRKREAETLAKAIRSLKSSGGAAAWIDKGDDDGND